MDFFKKFGSLVKAAEPSTWGDSDDEAVGRSWSEKTAAMSDSQAGAQLRRLDSSLPSTMSDVELGKLLKGKLSRESSAAPTAPRPRQLQLPGELNPNRGMGRAALDTAHEIEQSIDTGITRGAGTLMRGIGGAIQSGMIRPFSPAGPVAIPGMGVGPVEEKLSGSVGKSLVQAGERAQQTNPHTIPFIKPAQPNMAERGKLGVVLAGASQMATEAAPAIATAPASAPIAAAGIIGNSLIRGGNVAATQLQEGSKTTEDVRNAGLKFAAGDAALEGVTRGATKFISPGSRIVRGVGGAMIGAGEGAAREALSRSVGMAPTDMATSALTGAVASGLAGVASVRSKIEPHNQPAPPLAPPDPVIPTVKLPKPKVRLSKDETAQVRAYLAGMDEKAQDAILSNANANLQQNAIAAGLWLPKGTQGPLNAPPGFVAASASKLKPRTSAGATAAAGPATQATQATQQFTTTLGRITSGVRDMWNSTRQLSKDFQSEVFGNAKTLEGESPRAFTAFQELASPTAESRAVISSTAPKLEKELIDLGFTGKANTPTQDPLSSFFAVLFQDRLDAKRMQYLQMAQGASVATQRELKGFLTNGFFEDVVSQIDEGAAKSIRQMIVDGQYKRARARLANTFLAAKDKVADIPVQKWTGKTLDEWVATPGFMNAVKTYKDGIETVFNRNHMKRDGFFTMPGKTGAYIPLSMQKPGGKIAQPTSATLSITNPSYEEPAFVNNWFATGFRGDYDYSVDALRGALRNSITSTKRANLQQTIHDVGLSRNVDAKFTKELNKGAVTLGQRTYKPNEVVLLNTELGSVRNTFGTKVPISSPQVAMPKWLARELGWNGKAGKLAELSAFSGVGRAEQTFIDKILAIPTVAQLYGAGEFFLHGLAEISPYASIVAAMDRSMAGVVLGKVPIAKQFYGVAKILNSDPSPGTLREMAGLGMLHGRSLAYTWDPAYARQTGAHLVKPQFGSNKGVWGNLKEAYKVGEFGQAALFGPQGIDTKIRASAYQIMKDRGVDMRSPEAFRVMQRLIDYNHLTQGRVMSRIRNSPILQPLMPFISAGGTRIGNQSREMIGLGPAASQGTAARVADAIHYQIGNGVTGAVTAWYALNYAATGEDPLEDPKAKIGKIRLPAHSMARETVERVFSALGTVDHPLWGDNDKDVYIDMASPMFYRTFYGGLKQFGINQMLDRRTEGKAIGADDDVIEEQMKREFGKATLNTGLSLLGPAVHTISRIAAAKDPLIVSNTDLTGKENIEFANPTGVDPRGDWLEKRLKGASNINTLVENLFEVRESKHAAKERGESNEEIGDKWLQLGMQYLAGTAVGRPQADRTPRALKDAKNIKRQFIRSDQSKE